MPIVAHSSDKQLTEYAASFPNWPIKPQVFNVPFLVISLTICSKLFIYFSCLLSFALSRKLNNAASRRIAENKHSDSFKTFTFGKDRSFHGTTEYESQFVDKTQG